MNKPNPHASRNSLPPLVLITRRTRLASNPIRSILLTHLYTAKSLSLARCLPYLIMSPTIQKHPQPPVIQFFFNSITKLCKVKFANRGRRHQGPWQSISHSHVTHILFSTSLSLFVAGFLLRVNNPNINKSLFSPGSLI